MFGGNFGDYDDDDTTIVELGTYHMLGVASCYKPGVGFQMHRWSLFYYSVY